MTEEELRELRIVPRIFETSDLRKRGIRSLDRVFAMSSYHSSPLLKKAIHTFKYRQSSLLPSSVEPCAPVKHRARMSGGSTPFGSCTVADAARMGTSHPVPVTFQ